MPHAHLTEKFPGGISTVAVLGTGVIGSSWCALLDAKGYTVKAWDPSQAALEGLGRAVQNAQQDLSQLFELRKGSLEHCESPEAAAKDAEFVLECGPENTDPKKELLGRISAVCSAETIIASNSSSFLRTQILGTCSRPERLMLAHPFNPVHLMPLVEIVAAPGPALDRAVAFFAALDKHPVVLKKEVIGYVANRFNSAVWREALYLLQENVATAEEIDAAMVHSVGMRWSAIGPFLAFHLAGGAGGIRHYLSGVGKSHPARWAAMKSPELTPEFLETVARDVEGTIGRRPLEELAKARDEKLLELLKSRRRNS